MALQRDGMLLPFHKVCFRGACSCFWPVHFYRSGLAFEFVEAEDQIVAIFSFFQRGHDYVLLFNGCEGACFGPCSCMRLNLHGNQGVIQLITLAHGAAAFPVSGMGIERIREFMESLVSDAAIGRRHAWRSKQRQPNHVVLCVVSIFAGIEQTESLARIRDISPPLSRDFKLCLFRGCVSRCGSLDSAKGNLKGSFRCLNIYRETNLEQDMRLVPIYLGMDIDARDIRVYDNVANKVRVLKFVLDPHDDAFRTILYNFDFLWLLEIPALAIEFHFPCILNWRQIDEGLKQIAASSWSHGFLVR